MSLDALTDGELRSLIEYNLEQIRKYPNPVTGIPNKDNWAKCREHIMRHIERIDRIVALKAIS